MRFGMLATGSVLGVALLCAAELAAQEEFADRPEALESRIWLDRGASPVLRRGDLVRVFYRVSRDAYVSVFHIDTNGFARLLHPGSPTDDHLALGGRDYRVLFPESRYWQVDEDEGKGYLFVVTSPAPLDLSEFAYSRHAGGWNLGMSHAAYRDPFLMMDDMIAALVPEWEGGDYALDFVAYDIDRPHDYPRFLCYECHGFMPIFDWNPYDRWCTDFRVVIHDDPYYYPVYRYSGDRVVYTRPLAQSRPMFEFKERALGEAATPLIRTRPGTGTRMPGAARGAPAEGGGASAARVPGPRARLDAGVPPAARAAEGRDERPVLQRRAEPPPAGSARSPAVRSGAPPPVRSPAVRPRTPPPDRPPPSTGRPPPRPAGSPAAANPRRSPGSVRSEAPPG